MSTCQFVTHQCKTYKNPEKKGKKRTLTLLLNKKIIFTVFENHQKSPIKPISPFVWETGFVKITWIFFIAS